MAMAHTERPFLPAAGHDWFLPLYDPIIYDSGKRNGRYADLYLANWIGFFLEEVQGNQIWGRIIPIGGIYDRSAADAPMGAFPLAIRLVK